MAKRFMLSLTGLALGIALVLPTPAFARMHFTTTNERLDALTTRANSSVTLTNPADIQTQLNEITTQAQAAKAAAEEAAQRPASDAEDKSVLAKVGTDMDAVVAAANRAKTATGADQQAALKEIQTQSQDSSKAVKDRIAAQLAAPGAVRRARRCCRSLAWLSRLARPRACWRSAGCVRWRPGAAGRLAAASDGVT